MFGQTITEIFFLNNSTAEIKKKIIYNLVLNNVNVNCYLFCIQNKHTLPIIMLFK